MICSYFPVMLMWPFPGACAGPWCFPSTAPHFMSHPTSEGAALTVMSLQMRKWLREVGGLPNLTRRTGHSQSHSRACVLNPHTA